MKPRSASRLSFPLASAIAALLASSAHAATFYWDNNNTAAGFGIAGGTWAQNSTSGGTSARWKTDVTGVAGGSATQATTNTDIFNFGDATNGLGAGTITVSGSVTMGNTFFGAASGAIVLTGGTINYAPSATITVNNASNTINSVLGSTMTGTFTKAGSGILILGGTNLYTAATSITGGTLRAGAAAGGKAFGTNSAVTLANTAGVTLDLNGFAQTIGSLAGGGATGGNVTLGNNATLTTGANNTSTSFAGIISGTGTGGLTKNGTGTQTLTGANTYAGATTINDGAIDLGGGTANGSLSSSTLTLAGGSFSYTRTGTNTQGFTSTSIGGNSMIAGAAGNTLNLGTVTRTGGGNRFHDFGTTGLGLISASTASNTNGIMAGFTVGDSWAVANGTGVAISGLAGGSYTLSSVAGTTGASYNGNNIDVDSAQTPDAAITANSLRFSSAAANTLNLQGTNVITSGGILVGSGVGANLSTITGGTLAGANTKDLSIIQNNSSGGLTISSVIANNTGATALTKSGAGLLTLSGNNSFTGGVFIHGGKLTLGDSGALNSTAGSENAVTFGPGSTGTLALNGNSAVIRSLATDATTPGTAVVENASGTDTTLTIGNAGNASSSFAGVIQNGTGSGKLALTKAGTGTLTLSGANTYTGGTTLAAGTVAISNATSFGTGDVTVTGTSQITANGGISYANAINVGTAALSVQAPSATATTATFSGVLSGSGTINFLNSSSGNNQVNLAFTNTNNTFTGNVIGPAGNANGADYFSFNSIGDGGNFTLNKSGNRGGVIYAGSSAITFNTRQLALGTSFGGGNGGVGGGAAGSGLNGNGIPQNSFQNNAADPAHAVTFNTNMAMSSVLAASVFYFDGSNTGNNTFAGTISNPSNLNLSIGKWGAGKWILSGSNSFLGDVVIGDGTLSVNTIDIAANNQSLGKGSLIILGHGNTSGTLEYTGAANAGTGKQIVLGNLRNNNHSGGGGIVNNGNGTLTFSNSIFNDTAGITITTVDRTLTLGGTNNGANEIQGTIQDNVAGAAQTLLTKTGAGTWVLSGNNTYTGATNITGGTLRINGSTSTSSLVTVGASGTLGGIGTVGGATTVNGTFSPGQSPGTMTFLNTLALAGSTIMEIDGTNGAGVAGGHDFVNLTGAGAAGVLTYGGTMTIDIGVIFGAGSYTWNLFDFASETGGFTGITLADQYTGFLTDGGGGAWGLVDGNNTWSFTESDGVLGLTVIPEPRAALLGGLGLLALLRRRR